MATQTLINADVDLDLKRKRSETSSVSELDTSRTKGIEAEGTTKEKQKKKKSKKAEINEDSDMADIKEIMKQWKQINTKLERLESKIEKAVLKGDGTIRSSIKDLMTEMKEDLLKSVTNRIEILEGKLFEKEESSEKLAQKVTALEEQLEKNTEETFRVNNQLDFEHSEKEGANGDEERELEINHFSRLENEYQTPLEGMEEFTTKTWDTFMSNCGCGNCQLIKYGSNITLTTAPLDADAIIFPGEAKDYKQNGEDCPAVIQAFMRDELGIETEISVDHARRSRAPNTQAPSASKPVSTSNPFAVLDSRTPQNTTTRRPTLAGKKKATSPLETGTYFKKPNCYNSDSDTTSEIDLTDSPSLLDTQPPPQERGDQESLTPSDNPGASDQTADQRPEENM
ncbi:hypothetical protein MAR_013067 [Mya arenaria]|uniref:Uncharacterized protein n=1 Tax=Mya arenaria TaxID=6604 RepID=A0ABY7FYT4_MYAAR|nr:hypothetical protein MAR_013067 [Mya arenaria]